MNKGKGSSIGLEFQILDDKNHPDAKEGVLGNRTVASLYDLITAENLQESRGKRNIKPNTWHRARIFVDGGHVEHWLDNIKMLEYDRYSQVFKSLVKYSKYQKWVGFGLLDAGHILLQDHGDKVSFKNIKNTVKKKGIAFTKENKVRITDTKQYFDIEFLYSFVFKYF